MLSFMVKMNFEYDDIFVTVSDAIESIKQAEMI